MEKDKSIVEMFSTIESAGFPEGLTPAEKLAYLIEKYGKPVSVRDALRVIGSCMHQAHGSEPVDVVQQAAEALLIQYDGESKMLSVYPKLSPKEVDTCETLAHQFCNALEQIRRLPVDVQYKVLARTGEWENHNDPHDADPLGLVPLWMHEVVNKRLEALGFIYDR